MISCKRFTRLSIMMLWMCGLMTSCIKEDLRDCPLAYRLYVKAIDVDGNDITTSGDVREMSLFVFNDTGEMVDIIRVDGDHVKSRKSINFDVGYPGSESYTFVAWANSQNASVVVPDPSHIKRLEDLSITLSRKGNMGLSPDDLFYGKLEVPTQYGGLGYAPDQTIVVMRKTCQVNVEVKHLKEWNHHLEGKYSLVLRETLDTYDHEGKLIGNNVSYIPAVTMEDGVLRAPSFRTFPTAQGKSFELDILYEGKVIFTATMDSKGEPFVPEVGRMLNIHLNFGASVSVRSVVTPWNVIHQFVEY